MSKKERRGKEKRLAAQKCFFFRSTRPTNDGCSTDARKGHTDGERERERERKREREGEKEREREREREVGKCI